MSNDIRSNHNQPYSGQGKSLHQPAPHVNGSVAPLAAANPIPPVIQVSAGKQLPPSAAVVPNLGSQQALSTEDAATGNSAIAPGMSFQGNAVVSTGCVVSGNFVGNVSQAEGVQISVTVTETGTLKGDVKAHQIVVMGRTQGLLDASAGLVTLHESANVQGHVRYAKLQVNGAELNATLEKSTTTRNGA